MEANDFTIADPDDAGMLDVVGFDTAAPSVMSDFIREDLQQKNCVVFENDQYLLMSKVIPMTIK